MISSVALHPTHRTRNTAKRMSGRVLSSFPALMALALSAQLVVLLPVANTAYWGDDAVNSYVSGAMRVSGLHWWHFFWAETLSQWNSLGRPMPLGVLQTFGWFYLVDDRVAYKMALIALTLVASGLVGLLVRRLGASPAIAALVAALPAVVWQLHLSHDPLISYAGLMQTVTIYSTGAMLMFLSWLRRGGAWKLGIVALLTLCACFTYESSYLLAGGLVLIAWRKRNCSLRRAIVLAWPGLSVAGACLLVVFIHVQSFPATSGYRPNANLAVLLSGWAKIIVSGLPIVGWSVTPGPSTLPPTDESAAIVRGILVALLLCPLLLAAVRYGAGGWLRNRRAGLTIVGVTAVMMLTPSLLTAAAPQYANELQWGWGYLPMFFTALGWAVLGALAIGAVLAHLARRPVVAVAASLTIAAAAGVATAINAEASARVVQYMQPLEQSRNLLEASFTHGVLAGVPTFSTVLWYAPDVVFPHGAWVPDVTDVASWTREFVNRPLTMHLLNSAQTSPEVCTDALGSPSTCEFLKTPTFWLRTWSSGSRGFVAVAEFGRERWRATDNPERVLTSPNARPVVFVRDPRITVHSQSLPFNVTMSRGGGALRIVVPASRLRLLRGGAGWVLAQLPPQPRFIASSIAVTQT